ncbi:nitrilase-related carbon-nitrogen hydrolase [Rubricella aquisinus]|uniref:nitrilase-related carbon-nitrogen hydrolase n=1 Tax=Rubricella aquisinus TaxID=2028108 RepID=UPI00160920FD
MRAALIQLCASDDPVANLAVTEGYVREAAAEGATLIATPEVTNCVSSSRAHQEAVFHHEEDDPTLARLRDVAAELGVTLLIGSLGLRTRDADGRFANRSFLIAPDGSITARYDKLHMFDVDVDGDNVFRESAGYRPGDRAVMAKGAGAQIGMTICYDLRFPTLHAQLARAGAEIITVPAAFTVPTGRAHWEVLLRARAIETGCFVLAPAQCGTHHTTRGAARASWGHSLAISPWGEVLADGGEAPGVTHAILDLEQVAAARARIPNLQNGREVPGP